MPNEIPPERQHLEELVIQTSDDVDNAKPNGEWLDDPEFETFLKSWEQLHKYYVSHPDDTQISVEVMREYLHFTRLLRHATLDDRLSGARHEQAQQGLIHMEFLLGDIITEIVTYRDWKERNG